MLSMNRSIIRAFALAAVIPLAATCGMNSAQQGALIGAGAGGAVGAAVGHVAGSTITGAIVGAAVGGTAGALIGHQMDQQAEELAYELPGATIQRIGEGIAVTFPDGLLFAYDSDQVTSAAGANLRNLAASLRKYDNTRTLIVGHTDSDGSASYNMGLSEQRASSVARFIVNEGVNYTRVGTDGRGEDDPIATNSSADGRRQNRRVEVAIFAMSPNSSN
jgi:outer membrane protein OmpA-like peptidoglycan-associated protein